MIDINRLKNISNVENYKFGQIIIREGESIGTDMYIILKGSVNVYKNYLESHEVLIAILQTGGFFGEMSLFLNKTRTATVVAAEDVVLLALSHYNAYDFFRTQPEATFLLIKTLCERLEATNDSYDELARQINRPDDCLTNADIFPKGHRSYDIEYEPENPELVYKKQHICPICGCVFEGCAIKHTVIKLDYMEDDFRPRHKGIDTLYYEVITCPRCWYSAITGMFNDARVFRADLLNEKLSMRQSQIGSSIDRLKNVDRLFTGFYLALECAALCFMNYDVVIAKLWLRISWLYHDCDDYEMELFAARQALSAYIAVLSKSTIDKHQQLHLIIAELCLKLKDTSSAYHYLTLAKNCVHATPVFLGQANRRIADLKSMGLV